MPCELRRLPRIPYSAILLLATGCSNEPAAPSNPGPTALTIVSGNTQQGAVGQQLPLPLVIKATNSSGDGVADLIVEFSVTSGGGNMYVAATTTDRKGMAQNYWTVGTSTAEPQSAEVRAILSDGTMARLTFTATPLAGPATQIVSQTGDGQTVLKGTSVPVSPAVVVTDQYGNPVPGLSVTFSVATGGGSVTGATKMTDLAGLATVGNWTVGPTHGQNTLTATASGSGISGNPVTFTATALEWVMKTPMPTPRLGLAVGVVNGVLYAVGGQYISLHVPVPLGTVEAYDPATDSWSTKASMPTPRSGLAVGVVNGVLYAVGGSDGVGTVEAYDPVTDSWSTKAAMPTDRGSLGVGVVNGVLYAVGGSGSSSAYPLGTVEAYDPATDSWTTKSSMPTPRANFAVGVVNGTLYAVSGEDNNYSPVGTVEAYDPATDSWSTKASVPTPLVGHSVGVVNGLVYAIGGLANIGGLVGTVVAYDPTTDTWSAGLDPMPTPRSLMGVGVVNGWLYAVGGYAFGNSVPTLEALFP